MLRSPAPSAAPSVPAHPLAVVSGASSGIGEAIARRLAADGARVVMLARRGERLDELARDIEQSPGHTGGSAVGYAVDLGDAEATAEVCARILAEQGVPHVVVNNAGAGRFLAIEETSPAEAEAQMRLPYLAAFGLTRGLVEPMMARGSGTILQINSPASIVPWPGAVGYAAARWAVRGFTEALRQDLYGTGIAVGSVTPARVHSDYFAANPDSQDRVPKAEVLVGTMTPEQVAGAVAHALAHRPGRDTVVPWRLAVMMRWARVFPGTIAAPYRWTGRRRAGRARRRP